MLIPTARLLVLALVTAALAGAAADAEADNTPVSQLAWHDGMVLFGGALRKTVPPNASAATAASAVPCACSDAAPRDTGAPRAPGDPILLSTDCFYQAAFGNCNASFMQSYLSELVFTDGFCQLSCGRCPCCSAPTTVLKQLGATRFLQALEVAQPSLLDLLSHPGWMGTLLVPTDAAFDAALAKYPSALQDPPLLQQVLKFHMLPPEPRTRGLWTTPFMATGARLYTMADGNATLRTAAAALPAGTTAYGGLTGLSIRGPVNTARVIGPSDLGACKAYLTVIDAVLLPVSPAAVAATPAAAPAGASALGPALGAGGRCVLQANAGLNGTTLVAGASNRQRTVGDCCTSCQREIDCNSFQYCSQRGGCRLGDGTSLKFGECELLHDAAVAAGEVPEWAGWSATLPLISGYVTQAAMSAVAAG